MVRSERALPLAIAAVLLASHLRAAPAQPRAPLHESCWQPIARNLPGTTLLAATRHAVPPAVGLVRERLLNATYWKEIVGDAPEEGVDPLILGYSAGVMLLWVLWALLDPPWAWGRRRKLRDDLGEHVGGKTRVAGPAVVAPRRVEEPERRAAPSSRVWGKQAIVVFFAQKRRSAGFPDLVAMRVQLRVPLHFRNMVATLRICM